MLPPAPLTRRRRGASQNERKSGLANYTAPAKGMRSAVLCPLGGGGGAGPALAGNRDHLLAKPDDSTQRRSVAEGDEEGLGVGG